MIPKFSDPVFGAQDTGHCVEADPGGADAITPYPVSGDTALFARGPSGGSWPLWTDPGAPAELCTFKKKTKCHFGFSDESKA